MIHMEVTDTKKIEHPFNSLTSPEFYIRIEHMLIR